MTRQRITPHGATGLSEDWRDYKEIVARWSPVPVRDLLFHKRFETVIAAYFVLGLIGAGAGGYVLTQAELSWMQGAQPAAVEAPDNGRHPAYQPAPRPTTD